MVTFFGVILLCCCAWWWVRGSAFMAFAVTPGAGEVTHHSFLFRGGVVVSIASAP